MYKKVLVVYDTKSGSTAEVAGLIGDTLLNSGAQVAVEPVASARKVDDYDAVISWTTAR
jgi:menaquinone-dependent protoporphyrinogen IX oxidase